MCVRAQLEPEKWVRNADIQIKPGARAAWNKEHRPLRTLVSRICETRCFESVHTEMNMNNLRLGPKRDTAVRFFAPGLEKRPVEASRHATPNQPHASTQAPQKHGLFDQWQPVRHRQRERCAVHLRESTDRPTHERGKMLLSRVLFSESPNAGPTPLQVAGFIALSPHWSLEGRECQRERQAPRTLKPADLRFGRPRPPYPEG
jgi:hypothetical protein